MPFNNDDFELNNFLSQWKEYGSYSGISSLLQVLVTLPAVIIRVLWKLSVAQMAKGLLFFGIAASLFTTYLCIKSYAKQACKQKSAAIEIGAMLAAFFYIFNPWSLGHLPQFYLWLGYAFLPLILLLFVKALAVKTFRQGIPYIILTAIAASFLSFASPHFLIYTAIALIAVLIINLIAKIPQRQSRAIYRQLLIFALLIVVLLVFNLYWILPNYNYLKINSEMASPGYLSYEINVRPLIITSIFNFLALRGTGGEVGNFIREIYLVFPALLIAHLILRVRKKDIFGISLLFVGFLSLVPSLLILLAPDFANKVIFTWPIISKFSWIFSRDVDRANGILAIAYALAIVLPFIYLARQKQISIGNNLREEKSSVTPKLKSQSKTSYLVLCTFIFAITLLAVFLPISYSHDTEQEFSFTNPEYELGKFTPLPLPATYYSLTERLYKDNKDVKVTWLPITLKAEKYSWSNGNDIDNIFSRSSRLPSISPDNSFARHFYSYLQSVPSSVHNLSHYYNIINTRYLIFRRDILFDDRTKLGKEEEALRSNSNGLEYNPNLSNENLTVYENLKPYSYVQKNEKNITVVGGLENLKYIFSIPEMKEHKLVISFMDQRLSPKTQQVLLKSTNAIFWNNTDMQDLVLAGLPDDYLIFPGKNNHQSDPIDKWAIASTTAHPGEWHNVTSDFIGAENWDFDYGQNIIYSLVEKKNNHKPPDKFVTNFTVKKPDDYIVMARIFENHRGGKLGFNLRSRNTVELETKNQKNRFKWIKLEEYNIRPGEHKLLIENKAGFNAVNAIAIIPVSKYQDLYEKTSKIVKEKENIFVEGDIFGSSIGKTQYPVLAEGKYSVNYFNNVGQNLARSECLADSSLNCKLTPIDLKNASRTAFDLLDERQLTIHDTSGISSEKSGKFKINTDPKIKHRRVMSPKIVIDKTSDYFIALNLETHNISNFKGVVRQYNSNESLLRTDELFSDVQGTTSNMIIVSKIIPREDTNNLVIELSASKGNEETSFGVNHIGLYTEESLQQMPTATAVFPKSIFDKGKVNARIDFEKKSPTQTHVVVNQATDPFIITFAESFDKGWRTTLPDSQIEHFPAFGVTNGFVISKEGNYEFDIYFSSQKPFKIGLIISLIAIGIGLIFTIVLLFQFHRKKQVDVSP
ncbi:MAG: hypothetical protein ACD_63C00008G0004 [uncultured bacterium]|nr:MAG: hypothetical protein ACD_63C00008G0004 [uncultured bacterium]